MQEPAGSSVLEVASQLGARQTEPSGYFWQAPLPSHLPLLAQLAAPSSLQSMRGSAAPAGAGEHLPRALGRAQVWQAPLQSVLQQTPSMHLPDWHWVPSMQS